MNVEVNVVGGGEDEICGSGVEASIWVEYGMDGGLHGFESFRMDLCVLRVNVGR